MRTLFPRLALLVVGAVTFSSQVADRVVSGSPGDPTLVYASVVLCGLGLGLSLDWLKKMKGDE